MGYSQYRLDHAYFPVMDTGLSREQARQEAEKHFWE